MRIQRQDQLRGENARPAARIDAIGADHPPQEKHETLAGAAVARSGQQVAGRRPGAFGAELVDERVAAREQRRRRARGGVAAGRRPPVRTGRGTSEESRFEGTVPAGEDRRRAEQGGGILGAEEAVLEAGEPSADSIEAERGQGGRESLAERLEGAAARADYGRSAAERHRRAEQRRYLPVRRRRVAENDQKGIGIDQIARMAVGVDRLEQGAQIGMDAQGEVPIALEYSSR